MLDQFSELDKELLKENLDEYHSSTEDTTKAYCLNAISQDLYNIKWIEYTHVLKVFVENAIKRAKDKNTLNYLFDIDADVLNNLGVIAYDQGNLNEAGSYWSKSLKREIETNDTLGIAGAVKNIAVFFYMKNNFTLAKKYYKLAYKLGMSVDELSVPIEALNYLGAMYKNSGKIEEALNCFNESLILSERNDYEEGKGFSFYMLAVTYELQGESELAEDYYNKAKVIYETLGDTYYLSLVNNSLSSIMLTKGDNAKALEFSEKSLKNAEDLNNPSRVASALGKIGNVYSALGKHEKALEMYLKSLEIYQTMSYSSTISTALARVGSAHKRLGNLKAAEKFGENSLKKAEELGIVTDLYNSSALLTEVYAANGQGLKALQMYKLQVKMNDSLVNEASQKATIKQQTEYEFEKSQIVKENEAKEQARLESEATGRRDNIQYSLIFLGILVLFVGIMMLGFIKVSPNIAEGLIFFAFLILFEFVLVFTEPYLEQYTNGEPMYNLLANSVIALLIFPLHDVLESKLKKRIVKK